MVVDGVIKPEINRDGFVDFLLKGYYWKIRARNFNMTMLPVMVKPTEGQVDLLKSIHKEMFERQSRDDMKKMEESYNSIRSLMYCPPEKKKE